MGLLRFCFARQRPLIIFKVLVVLILLTLLLHGCALLLFLSGGSALFQDDGPSTNSFHYVPPEYLSSPVIRGKAVTSVRFKVCDQEEGLQILAPEKNYKTSLVPIAQAIRAKYEDSISTLPFKTKAKGAPILASVSKLQRYLLKPLGSKDGSSYTVWEAIEDWPFSDNLRKMALGQIIHAAETAPIMKADNAHRGTQLKIEVELAGGQIALWKPQRYFRNVTLEGPPFGGKDRHFGEIASFYLSLLLGLDSAPITIGREVDLRTIFNVGTKALQDTFFTMENGSICVYGVCHFCKITDPVCSGFKEGRTENLEGALVLMLKKKFRTVPNPWRRTYPVNKDKDKGKVERYLFIPPWEISMDFCQRLMKDIPRVTRAQNLLNIVEVAIFDFLIGNGDRHHHEMLNIPSGKILLLDNGKSFGNAFEDFVDILAPLFQCCKIRETLYHKLKEFQGQLGHWLDVITRVDPLYPLLSDENLRALDRRVKIVLATVEYCRETIHRHNAQAKKDQHRKLFY